MKSRFTLQEYNKVYPTGSNAGKLYGTAKIHKLPESGTVGQLPLHPLVSNIGTASSCEALSENFSPSKQKGIHCTKYLDVQLIRTGDNIETCVFRKPTNTDIYIHWDSFAPFQWKYSTLKTLVYRAYVICSDNQHLESELNYLRKVFHDFNSYPHWFITKVVNEVNNEFNKQTVPPTPHIETTDGENDNIKKPMMILAYADEKGCTLIKSLKKNLQRALPINIQTRIIYTGTKLSPQLKNMKDPTPFEEQHHNMILFITPFVVLKTVMRITSVKVHDG